MSPATLSIRDAAEADLTRIVEIYNESIPGRMATADLEPVRVEDRQAWFHEHQPGTLPLWVAVADGEITGWLSFQTFYGRAAYRITAEISVYVAARHQRRGVAGALLSKAVAESAGLGLRNLIGLVFSHNTASLHLFESQGFERWGCLPGVTVLNGVERDVVIVGRRVG